MFGATLCIFLFFARVISQPCEDNVSVDISNGTMFHDGTVMYDGIRYPPKYVYTKNETNSVKTFGCLCEVKHCFRKCCPFGSVMSGRKCSFMPEYDNITRYGLGVHSENYSVETIDLQVSDRFGVMFGWPCKNVYLADEGNEYVQKDGQLYIELPEEIPPWTLRTPDQYCLDTFVTEDDAGVKVTRLDALVCFQSDPEDNHNYLLSSVCMLISAVFILATLGVYGWLPELRNLYGQVLMAYLSCLLVAFVLLACMQLLLYVNNITTHICLVLTFVIYFSLLSAFFWMNVMCFDIYWTFSGKRGLSLEKLSSRGRFLAYSAYAFGVPSLLTALIVGLEFSGLPLHPLMPAIRHHGCFIHGKRKLLYLYGPILILCLANMSFFTLTAIRIARINQQTSVLQSKESATHDNQRKDKQSIGCNFLGETEGYEMRTQNYKMMNTSIMFSRLLLYVKLFCVMGISWILEVVAALYPEAIDFWQFTDSYNVLIGCIIFIIFVCKRKIFRLIKKRIKERFHHEDKDSPVDLRLKRIQNWKNDAQQRASVDTMRSTICVDSDSNKTAKF